ncbi:hypothetical protein TNCT_348221 [Trichonephila clavata]|uniref:Secreted protein n=1 Tax=Trichonephila clavata TaxID=2740835 RepID=A0A8X6F200_TRICU|nr:hypothetical protein TNCT_348221 [Trichonephila clavata]
MMAWIRIFILTLHKLHALQPFLRGNVSFATVSQRKCEVQMNNYYLSSPEKLFHSNWNCLIMCCLLWNYDGLDQNIHFNLAQVTCFATVSQRKCEVQMNNYYLSSPEKLFHSNWNCLIMCCLLWNFATVSQRKCELQMKNYYLSSPEKLFHSNWNCLIMCCLLWK